MNKINKNIKQNQINQKTLKYALLYHKIGFNIIPANGKTPTIPWKKYQSTKITKQDIHNLWNKHPESNIALITGKISSIIVIDVDTENLPNFLEKILQNKSTWIVKTKRGYHFYFKISSKDDENLNCIKLDKIDVKANGGIAILPPSIHPEGVKYKWISFIKQVKEPLDFSTIKHHIFTDKENKENNKISIKKLYQGVEKGERNISMTKIAGSLFADGLNKDEVFEILYVINKRNSPPLPASELKQIVNSIASKQENFNTNLTNILTLFKYALEKNISFKNFAKQFYTELEKILPKMPEDNREFQAAIKNIGKNLLPLLWSLIKINVK